ncbi:putative uncharacterized protein DDB_G0277255 [Eupeodes corollae]|uniref:putative uncharacterized protein DDB_G0277255 n=1 Tax=Eupeodes corollae TaxID=290404 RepID=UPI00248FBDC7|nr:putative uncharacterized protein DDB_G0277255 [Eupeodes corollae]
MILNMATSTTDDRPISVYDNLNTILPNSNTNSPKTPIVTMNTNTTSPYADISFKFDASRSNQQQQQQNITNSPLNHNHANNNQNSIKTPSPIIHHYSPNNNINNNSPYSQVNKPNSQSQSQSQLSRPISQHLDTNGYSGISAVKAALNDAKSKFFGLNGNNNIEDPTEESLLSSSSVGAQPDHQKLSIVPKSQPKYQNIPENSAIFKSAQVNVPASPPTPPPPPPPPPPHSSSPIRDNSKSNSPEMSRPSTAFSAHSSPISSIGPNSKLKDSPNSVQYSTIQHKPISSEMDFSISSQPSQAVYMATTVPQNIKGSKIAGRHTPTRNSLRHSRMLVVNKNYNGPPIPNPMEFRFPRMTRILLILEVIIGILITFLGVWILLLAPHTDIQDNPYWSGLALLFSGMLGLILIRYKRIKRHKLRENCFTFIKFDSYVLAILATLLCAIAFCCAAIHIIRLQADDTKCVSSDILLEHGACQCTFNTNSIPVTNGTLLDLNPAPDSSYSVVYRELSCSEVRGVWMSILNFSLVLNCIGFLLAIIYLILLFFFRYREVYTSVQTSVF